MGTVIDDRRLACLKTVSMRAVAQGARLLVGNERRGALYSPTVIDRVDPAMTVAREETVRSGFADHPVPPTSTRRFEFPTVRRTVCRARLYQSPGLHHTLHQRTGCRHGERARSARLSSRIDAVGGSRIPALVAGRRRAMKSFTNIKTYSLPWV